MNKNVLLKHCNFNFRTGLMRATLRTAYTVGRSIKKVALSTTRGE